MLLAVPKKTFRKKLLRSSSLVIINLVFVFGSLQPNTLFNIYNGIASAAPKNPSALPAPKVNYLPSITAQEPTAISTPVVKDSTIDRELLDKRTDYTSTFINKDGSKTLRYSFDQQNYKDGNVWKKIDNTIGSKTRTEPFGNTLLNIKPGSPIGAKSEFNGKAGKISADMNSLSKGLDINLGQKTINMKPVGAKDVLPEKFDEYGVIYKDAWPNVDLRYELRGENVKEIIVLKSKEAKNSFDFTVTGGNVINHPTKSGYLTIEGMPDEFSFSQLSLDVNAQGVMSWPPLTQSTTPNGIRITLDEKWMKAQPKTSFPMLIDPSFGREATSWAMFKSDGYSCGPSVCYANTGTLYNSGWKSWRTYFNFPYSDLAGKKVINAVMHGVYKAGAGGTTENRWINMGHAPCISYNCTGVFVGNTVASTDFWINFTGRLQTNINNGDYGAWWSLWGEEGNYTTFKPYYTVYADVVYDTPTPQATIISPVDKQVLVTTEANVLRVNPVSDADGDAVQYNFVVTTGSDGKSGAIVSSDWTPTSQWTIPDGILQDGATYYWKAYTRGATQTDPNWTGSFKVDLRTGKDSTQAYDTFGDFGVDLATGNATTEISTHAIGALGGNIGVGLNYNTNAKANGGLTGEYWNVASGYQFSSGAPSVTPTLTRNDQDINFDWNTTSPGPGVNSDWFYSRWTGTFTAPNSSTYNFGAAIDDNIAVYINGSKVFERSCCSTVADYTNSTGVTLQAGQVVSVRVEFLEAVGAAYAKLFVKNGVQEQTVPRDWLKTNVQASMSQYGLEARYYKDNAAHTLPTNGYDPDRFLMSRVDSKLSFTWPDAVAPSPGLPSDFMTRWTGYITVPYNASYQIGANSDDGVKITLGTGAGGSDQVILNTWAYSPDDRWGTAVNLSAGVPTRITIEYFDGGGPGKFILKLLNSGLANNEMPVKWLSPTTNVVPDSWQLSLDVDGSVAYERLRTTSTSVILEDASKSTHEYVWTGSGYKPPVNEEGNLTKNNDNTFTFIDSDGQTYIFSPDGKLKSLTSPTDDRNPASLKYEYSGDPSRLVKIVDGVTSERYGQLYYKSVNDDGTCVTASGFDSAPAGMLCAFKTSDGNVTRFQYRISGGITLLSRVEKPGQDQTDYGYDSLGRLISTRDTLANDAIRLNARADDNSVLTEISYNTLGRVSSITLPAANAGDSRALRSYEYNSSEYVKLSRFYNNQNHYTSSVPNVPGYWKELELGSVSTVQKVGTKAVYSCKISWDEFASFDTNCEGQQKLGLLGYFFEAAPAGISSQQIFGCMVNGTGEHFVNALNCAGNTTRISLGYAITDSMPLGSTKQHQQGVSEVYGFNRYIEYDALYRTTRDTDATNQSSTMTWDRNKDLVYSSTGATGLTTTYIYDSDDKLIEQYGPAPANMFGSDRRPTASNVNIVPKTTMGYDENITGLAVSYMSSNAKPIENTLGSGQTLSKGQSIWSNDRRFQFIYQTDGNIVLYGNGGAIWNSNTYGVASTRLTMQNDGNLVLYDTNVARWYSGWVAGITSASLVMQDDGNAVIFRSNGSTWATNTGGWPPAGSANVSLIGAPLLHATNINTNGTIGKNFGTTHPVPGQSGAWGMRMTGKMKLPASGTWGIRIQSDGGVRLLIDDTVVLDDWKTGSDRSRTITYSNQVANSYHRVTLDYYHAENTNASFNLYMTPPGGGETANTAQYFGPNYGLTTSQTAYDSTSGNNSVKSVYSRPEYGLIEKTIADQSNLNLENTATYEQNGSGYLRQTSRTQSGGSTIGYTYYSSQDYRDNPCTLATESVNQAGRAKIKSEADPDGSGPAIGRSSEVIYDAAGRAIATRFNNDQWTCSEFDARGRQTKSIQPMINGREGRVTQTEYAYGGNPFVTRALDSVSGNSSSTIDLLGRLKSTVDVWGNVYTLTYDNLGNVTQKSGPIGNEEYLYNSTYQIIGYKIDGITYATITYDSIGNVATVTYPEAKDQNGVPFKLTQISRDSLKRINGSVYQTSDGKTYSESTVMSQIGRVINTTQQYDGQTIASAYTYDTIGRLINASVGQTKFEYGYTYDSATCSSVASSNPLSGKIHNRATYKVTNLSTNAVVTNESMCYNAADQLIYSNNSNIGAPTYDDHGNTTSFSGNGTAQSFEYNASDQNIAVNQGNKRTEYLKTSTGSILRKKEFVNGNLVSSYRYSAGGKILQQCTLNDDTACTTVDRYIALPGSVTMTLSPTNSDDSRKVVYSILNSHGDTSLTVSAQGKTSPGFGTIMAYGAYGEDLISGTSGSTNQTSINATDATMGWASDPTRKVDANYSTKFIQMGSRVYIPSLGRFLQNDPVDGGSPNAYVYTYDPINSSDYSGNWIQFIAIAELAQLALIAIVVLVVVMVFSNPTVQQGIKDSGKAISTGISNAVSNAASAVSKAFTSSKADTNSKPKNEDKKCSNCGIYKFVDTGATNIANTGKVYIGKTVDFNRRQTQHGARVTPGSWEVVERMDGRSSAEIRIAEQHYINLYLMMHGASPFDVKSGAIANKINAISEKNAADKFVETLELGPGI